MVLGITGATGLIGGHLARLALAEGISVRILCRSDAPELRALGANLIPGDLTDRRSLENFANGCSVVVHAAAALGGSSSAIEINVGGTNNVLEACRAAGVTRLVHVSTPSVLVDGTHQFNLAEDHPPPAKPIGLYAQTKLEAEHAVRQVNDIEWVIVRPKAVFGPGDRTLLPTLVERIRRKRLVRIGRHPVLVGLTPAVSAARALLLAASVPDVSGRTYHIDNGEAIDLWQTIEQLRVAILAHWHPLKTLSYGACLGLARAKDRLAGLRGDFSDANQYQVTLLGRSQTLDLTAAQRDLGYEPQVSVLDAMTETCEVTLGSEVATRWALASVKSN